MDVRVKFVGFPEIKRVLGGVEIPLQVKGDTLGDLVGQLIKKYGDPMRCGSVLETGALEPSIRVLVNEKDWILGADLSFWLKQGDCVTFLLMMGGG
jgi:hypothetical protein